jgi:hypothetical protein
MAVIVISIITVLSILALKKLYVNKNKNYKI